MKENEPKTIDEISENQAKGFLSEFLSFLMHNKNFWLGPIIIVFVLFGILIIFGGSSVAPFIYPLF